MKQVILSAGIDIGTSTTQLIFSRITIENLATSYTVPRISIVNKEVIYKSDIYFTPLLSATEIDAQGIKRIIEGEYKKAGMSPADVSTGAVIITGETARKQNANTVLDILSGYAGDFVVATAGPDLESVLSARGAGVDELSKEKKLAVANLDVGGGTTNIAVFDNGTARAVACLDIGGRLIKVENGKITYIYRKIKELAAQNGIAITEGESADIAKLKKICALMADMLAQSLNVAPHTAYYDNIFTNDGKGIDPSVVINAATFTGGVADCIYSDSSDVFRYGDIGVLLGQAIKESAIFSKLEVLTGTETIRATVVGAGSHTTEISGSTIMFDPALLPIKNLPIIRVSPEDEKTLPGITASIAEQLRLYEQSGRQEHAAIALSGYGRETYVELQELARAITEGARPLIERGYPMILVLENDVGKALGHAVNIALERRVPVISIDGIKTLSGDYIDIGTPMAYGRVLPVVIKTLIFNSK